MMTRVDEALEEIHQQCGIMSVREEEWLADLQALAGNEVLQVILAACIKHQVTPDALINAASPSPCSNTKPTPTAGRMLGDKCPAIFIFLNQR